MEYTQISSLVETQQNEMNDRLHYQKPVIKTHERFSLYDLANDLVETIRKSPEYNALDSFAIKKFVDQQLNQVEQSVRNIASYTGKITVNVC